ILFFIFILQLLWMYIPELAGKGLSIWFVLKFLSYAMPTMVPLILPLSILLASIMTFGSFAENYEFAAMKSAGMSLGRASKGLTVFILFLAGIAFLFANDVIPYSKYKVKNFRNNLKEKPSMAIAEGQFNDIGSYNIKVDEKYGDNDQLLRGVIIHKKSAQGRNTTVTKANRGELISKEDSNILQLVLYDGHHYEDIISKDFLERQRVPFAKATFEKYIINMDLSGLVNIDLDSDSGENADGLLNVSELRYTIDSLKVQQKNDEISYTDNIHHRMTSVFQKDFLARQRVPFAKATFEKYIINMDLSGLVNIDLDSDSGENADGLLNVSELRYTIDSLKVQQKNDEISYTDNIHHRMTSVFQ